MGFEINARYLDEGWGYIGEYTDGDDAITIGDVTLIGVYCEKLNGKPTIPPLPKTEFLFNIKDFTAMFGRIGSNNYHPNELSAEIISIFLIDDMLNKKTKYASLALHKYKTVFHKRE